MRSARVPSSPNIVIIATTSYDDRLPVQRKVAILAAAP
jgi:hypothetical protein